ncbi:unnamed protein product [Clonostachys rosea]|uniref:Lipocalin-like domain-containing protein n=1 Tax=Bionectria ochroleuca TaxID=29856 RepID=A0ABY6U7D7_BIOOC|nr:unnamed protein product [Clonostachys rosea]
MYTSRWPSLLTYAAVASATLNPSSCPLTALKVRLPPYLDSATNASGNETSASSPATSDFLAPPPAWFLGTWTIRRTSGTSYLSYGNLQWDLTPTVTTTCLANSTSLCPLGGLHGVINEVTSWAPADNKTALNGAIGGGGRPVASVRAYNTPRRLNFPELNADWDAVYDNTITDGPGKGFMQSWSVMHWSLDEKGMPWMVVHEAPALFPNGEWGVPAVHVISQNRDGVDESTLRTVLEALKDLGNDEVTEQVEILEFTRFDGNLPGGAVICAELCQKNGGK